MYNLDLEEFEEWLRRRRGSYVGRNLECAQNPLCNFVRDRYPEATNVTVTAHHMWTGGNGRPMMKMALPLWARSFVRDCEAMPEVQLYGINRTVAHHRCNDAIQRFKRVYPAMVNMGGVEG